MDMFDIEAIDIGDVRKMILTYVAKEAEASWSVDRALLQAHPLGGEEFIFDCNRIIDTTGKPNTFAVTVRNPGKPFVNAKNDDYIVFVSTGPDEGMSCDCSVYLTLFGDKAPTDRMPLVKKNNATAASKSSAAGAGGGGKTVFRSGAVDSFQITWQQARIGALIKGRIEHDSKSASGKQGSWFLDKFCVQSLARPRDMTHHFNIERWLSTTEDDGDVVRESSASFFGQLAAISANYQITFHLGSKTSAAVPSNVDVYVVLFGNSPMNSGKRVLRKPMNDTPFLIAGSDSTFAISAVGVGPVQKLLVGHNCKGIDFQMEINTVDVSWDGEFAGERTFEANKLLAKPHPDRDAEIMIQ